MKRISVRSMSQVKCSLKKYFSCKVCTYIYNTVYMFKSSQKLVLSVSRSKHENQFFFYSLRTFCPHLGSFFFCVVSSFTTFRPNFTSGLLQVILLRPRIGMLSLVTVSPVIIAFHSCCLSHHGARGSADRGVESLRFQVSIVRR